MTYKRVIIVPYKIGSASAKALKEALVAEGIRCFRKRTDALFVAKPTDLVLYYGGTESISNKGKNNTLNSCRDLAMNKLKAFEAFEEFQLNTVPWTEDKTLAQQWLDGKGTVMCRHKLSAHSGEGITIVEPNEELPDAPLYTKYVKKTYECRIHVFKGKVIDTQVKRRQREQDNIDHKIRNIHTGWVYCRENFTADIRAKELAIAACEATALDFGAVDIIYNQVTNTFYLLEVNTAPGLTGTTLTNYVEEIKKCL